MTYAQLESRNFSHEEVVQAIGKQVSDRIGQILVKLKVQEIDKKHFKATAFTKFKNPISRRNEPGFLYTIWTVEGSFSKNIEKDSTAFVLQNNLRFNESDRLVQWALRENLASRGIPSKTINQEVLLEFMDVKTFCNS